MSLKDELDDNLDDKFWEYDSQYDSEDPKGPRLYLKNVPDDLDENGIRNVCMKYGKIKYTKKMTKGNFNFAFVEFTNTTDAEKALRAINADRVLDMQAEFAREKPVKNYKPDAVLVSSIMAVITGKKPPSPPPERQNDTAFANLLDTDEVILQSREHTLFSQPYVFPNVSKELITDEDYTAELLLADPTKEFLYETYFGNTVNMETTNRKVISGRGVFSHDVEIQAKIQEWRTKFKDNFTEDKDVAIFHSSKLSDESFDLEKCEYCNALGGKYCNDCQAVYCSVQCVRQDGEHLQRCKIKDSQIYEIMPHENGMPNDPIPTEAEPIKNKTPVLITCAVDHRTLFVRPSLPYENAEYIKLMNDVVSDAKKAEYLNELPTAGSLIAAPFEDVYYRALVLKPIDADKVVVAFIDFGNVEVCRLSVLKSLSENLKRRKRLAKKITLTNIPEKCINDSAIHHINEIILKDIKLSIKFVNSGSNECELKPKYSTETLNQELNRILNPLLMIKNGDIHFYDEIVTVKIMGQNVKVVVLENLNLISSVLCIVKADDIDALLRIDGKVQDVGEAIFNANPDVYTPRVEEGCIVRICSSDGNKYYRGICREVGSDGHPAIYFLDYGNIRLIKIRNIRKMPTTLKNLHCLIETMIIKDFDIDDKMEVNVLLEKCKLLQAKIPKGTELILPEVRYAPSDRDSDRCVGELPADVLADIKSI